MYRNLRKSDIENMQFLHEHAFFSIRQIASAYGTGTGPVKTVFKNAGYDSRRKTRTYNSKSITTLLRTAKIMAGLRAFKPRFRTWRLTDPKHIDEFVRRYQDGSTVREIAEYLGYSHETVCRKLHERGIPMRPRGGNHNPTGRNR